MKTAFCFDLDGTVTSQEILPLLAKEIGIYEEISLLTECTMKGLIPFQNSFKLRVKLLSSISISRVVKIIDKVKLNEQIVDFIKRNKNNCFIVTGNLDVWISKLIKNKIGCEFYCSSANYKNNNILGINKIINKSDAVIELRKKYDVIVSVGDGMNDVPMFEEADIKIGYGGVHRPADAIIELSDYLTYNERGLCNILNTL